MKIGRTEVHFRYNHGRLADISRLSSIECSIFPIGYGVAVCHPKDNPKKSTGRKIAFGRAIRQINKESRTGLWQAYFEKFPNDKRS